MIQTLGVIYHGGNTQVQISFDDDPTSIKFVAEVHEPNFDMQMISDSFKVIEIKDGVKTSPIGVKLIEFIAELKMRFPGKVIVWKPDTCRCHPGLMSTEGMLRQVLPPDLNAIPAEKPDNDAVASKPVEGCGFSLVVCKDGSFKVNRPNC
jgi:hypothetical protein